MPRLALATALLLCLPAYAPTDWPRPKPKPLMDCWVDHDRGVTECEVRG